MKKGFRRTIKILCATCFMLVFVIVASYCVVKISASSSIFSQIDELPDNQYGLLLGSSPYLKNGDKNPYTQYRIESAARLYKSHKIKYIVVSGHSEKYYNEPAFIKKELIKKNVPAKFILIDSEGDRTISSILRFKKIFHQNQFTIISQQFQNERAIFIAHNFGINAIAFNCTDLSFSAGYPTIFRECLARVKVMLDIYITRDIPQLHEYKMFSLYKTF